MSRKHTQKLSSVTNFAQLGYGEETSKTKEARHDFSSQERAAESQNQSTSQARRAPPVPKLNINSIITDSTPMQRFDHLNMHTASHQGQIT